MCCYCRENGARDAARWRSEAVGHAAVARAGAEGRVEQPLCASGRRRQGHGGAARAKRRKTRAVARETVSELGSAGGGGPSGSGIFIYIMHLSDRTHSEKYVHVSEPTHWQPEHLPSTSFAPAQQASSREDSKAFA